MTKPIPINPPTNTAFGVFNHIFPIIAPVIPKGMPINAGIKSRMIKIGEKTPITEICKKRKAKKVVKNPIFAPVLTAIQFVSGMAPK